jgi:Tfp pilus assembly protein PilZ
MGMVKRQRIWRIPFIRPVYFGPERPLEHTSFCTDLSLGGICIKTDIDYRPGTRLYMIIKTFDKSCEADGLVVWSKNGTTGLIPFIKNSMGIKFTSVDQGLVQLYEKEIRNMLDAYGCIAIL